MPSDCHSGRNSSEWSRGKASGLQDCQKRRYLQKRKMGMEICKPKPFFFSFFFMSLKFFRRMQSLEFI